MSDGDDPRTDRSKLPRRRVVQFAAAAGAWPPFAATARSADRARARDDPPDPYPVDGAASDDPGSPVYFTHVAEHAGTARRLDRYESTGDPAVLYHRRLRRALAENPRQGTFDLVVSTMGERATATRRSDPPRTLHGFAPTAGEVRQLARFGDVTHVADVVATKVCLRNVAREDVPRVAHLPRVVELAPPGEPLTPSAAIDVSDVAGDAWDRFTSAHGSYTADTVKIGVMGAGYDATLTEYASGHASDVGFDRDLSKDFTEESDPFFVSNLDWGGHTTNVADTAAYVLAGGSTHDDMFVSLKIVSDETDYDDEKMREGLEYSVTEGIDVLNVSFGTQLQSACPATYCEELSSFTGVGGVPVAAAGNYDENYGTQYPACSWHTVGVGGVYEKDDAGNAVAEIDTPYGPISFDAPGSCDWCLQGSGEISSFSPEVYGVSTINTDADNYLSGTSFAAPQAAAAAAIDVADGGVSSYGDAVGAFESMAAATVVNPDEGEDAAEEGDLLAADHYF